MKNEIQKVFDFSICLESPYKLCDYRPTYGLALSKWIGTYDFWGDCDLDMLFGDLRKYFSDEILSTVDRCYVNGHISLWRNNEKMNTIFKFQEDSRGLNYQDVYTSPDSYYFDEQRGVYTKCLLNGVKFAHFSMRDPIQGEPYFYWGGVSKETQFVIYWQHGKLYSIATNGDKEELCYAHFFRRKFTIENYFPNKDVDSIKVLPCKAIINEDVRSVDYLEREKKFYKLKYKMNNLRNSLKRYGVIKTFERQIWTRKSNEYVREIEKTYSENCH